MQGDHFENILGYPITTLSKQLCLQEILGWVRSGEGNKYFVCANPHSLEMARQDPLLHRVFLKADLLVPDGIGIVIASKILGGKVQDRVTGSDIFWGLSHFLNQEEGHRYFFLGSTEQNLMKIEEKMGDHFPNIKVVGTYSPPFKPEFDETENQSITERINHANPDVLWIGMTAPKQERWIYLNKDRLSVRLIGPIGAVFDFFTGRVKRSHPFFQKTGLEWLPRFLQEPRRLWRRNLVSNPAFLLRVIRCRLTGPRTHYQP
jgi:N-acetylglucosaminyldiphosphoundecaprenol N-acetyl-beta-D-mannosaminyltransferase